MQGIHERHVGSYVHEFNFFSHLSKVINKHKSSSTYVLHSVASFSRTNEMVLNHIHVSGFDCQNCRLEIVDRYIEMYCHSSVVIFSFINTLNQLNSTARSKRN